MESPALEAVLSGEVRVVCASPVRSSNILCTRPSAGQLPAEVTSTLIQGEGFPPLRWKILPAHGPLLAPWPLAYMDSLILPVCQSWGLHLCPHSCFRAFDGSANSGVTSPASAPTPCCPVQVHTVHVPPPPRFPSWTTWEQLRVGSRARFSQILVSRLLFESSWDPDVIWVTSVFPLAACTWHCGGTRQGVWAAGLLAGVTS